MSNRDGIPVPDEGTRHSLDDVAAEFGIDLDELRDESCD